MALDEAVRENDVIVSAAFVEILLQKIQEVHHGFDPCIPINFPQDAVEKCIFTDEPFPSYNLPFFKSF